MIMAAGNQSQGRRNEGGRTPANGGAGAAKEQGQTPAGLTQNVQEGVHQAADRLREGYGAAREEMGRRYRGAEGTIARNPAPAVLIGFGIGFGLGLALTAILAHEEESWTDRYVPDSFRNLPDSFHRMKKRLPSQMPDTHLAESFHQLAESIRDIPAAVSKLMPGR